MNPGPGLLLLWGSRLGGFTNEPPSALPRGVHGFVYLLLEPPSPHEPPDRRWSPASLGTSYGLRSGETRDKLFYQGSGAFMHVLPVFVSQ